MLYYPALISYYIESYKDEYVITDSFYSLLDAACVCDALRLTAFNVDEPWNKFVSNVSNSFVI